MSFQHNSIRKNLLSSTYLCWDSGLLLREMVQNFKLGGTIGYGDSYLEFLFRHFKVFGLRVIVHDAAGAFRTHSGEGPRYSYMIRRRPNSCLLGHVTGLLICLDVKSFCLPFPFL